MSNSENPLWIGSFNWKGQNIVKYTHAKIEHAAFCNICAAIAQAAQTSFGRVYNYFYLKKDYRYTLTQVVKEDENDATTRN